MMGKRIAANSSVRLLVRHRDFSLVWTAGLISMMGDWILWIVLPIRVYELTGSSLATAGLVASLVAPQIVFGSFAGVFVDLGPATDDDVREPAAGRGDHSAAPGRCARDDLDRVSGDRAVGDPLHVFGAGRECISAPARARDR